MRVSSFSLDSGDLGGTEEELEGLLDDIEDEDDKATRLSNIVQQDLHDYVEHYQDSVSMEKATSQRMCEKITLIFQTILLYINPEIEILKNDFGVHRGIIRVYGQQFYYKQLATAMITSIILSLLLVSLLTNQWIQCYGETTLSKQIYVEWTDSTLSVKLIPGSAQTHAEYKYLVDQINNFDRSHLLSIPPTVFDKDYDITKLDQVLSAQQFTTDLDDLMTLMEQSENDRIYFIAKYFNIIRLILISNTGVCAFLILFVMFFGEKTTVAYFGQIIQFLSIIALNIVIFVYFGLANRQIEMYNDLFQCQFDQSLILLIVSSIIMLLFGLIMVLPRQFSDDQTTKQTEQDALEILEKIKKENTLTDDSTTVESLTATTESSSRTASTTTTATTTDSLIIKQNQKGVSSMFSNISKFFNRKKTTVKHHQLELSSASDATASTDTNSSKISSSNSKSSTNSATEETETITSTHDETNSTTTSKSHSLHTQSIDDDDDDDDDSKHNTDESETNDSENIVPRATENFKNLLLARQKLDKEAQRQAR